MCGIIVINKGEKEIRSPFQFKEFFGFYADAVDEDTPDDVCLCGHDFVPQLEKHGINFFEDWGDYYILTDGQPFFNQNKPSQ